MVRFIKVFYLFMIFGLLEMTGMADEVKLEKIKVGFFQFDGYHLQSNQSNGNIHRSGYGYELLQLLLPYTDWEYEYIGYEKGWSSMLPMLEHGDIDLLTSAVKIPEKEKKFDFSSRPIGFSSVIMTVKAGSTRYLPHDYEHWNGMKVGVLSDNSKNATFAQFARDKKFKYQEISFTQIDEMQAALQKGDIDAIVTGSLRRLQNEWLFEELDVRPFYMIVKKGNAQLLKEINAAIEKLEIEYPSFANDLRVKYYDHSISGGEEISFSLEEQTFRKQCQEEKKRFSVLVNPDRFPFSSFENGQLCGIMKTLLEKVKTRSGLELEPVFCCDRNEYYEKLHQRECDLVLDMRNDFSLAEQRGYILTSPYLSASIARISRKSFVGDMRSCAVVADSNMAEIVRDKLQDECEVKTYPNLDAVINAVKTGKENAGYIFTRTAENAILNDRSGVLTLDPADMAIQFSIGTRKELDRDLISIISKSVRSISKDDIWDAQRTDRINYQYRPTFRELLVDHPLTVFFPLLGLSLVLTCALVFALFYRRLAVKSAAALKKNVRMWQLLVNSLPIHVFAKEGKNLHFIFNNQARADFFGIELSKMNELTDYDFVSRDMADSIHQSQYELFEAGEGKREYFLHVKDKNGLVHHLFSIIIPFTDSDGTRMLLGCSVDQTDLEEARKRAIENAEWFQKTLISIGDAVLTTDQEGNITLINPVAEKLLGVAMSECLGKKHTDFFHLVSYLDESEVPSPVERCLTSGEIVSLSNHTDLISREGTRYHISDSAAPIMGSNGEISGAILVFRDVTREYNLRDKLQQNTVQLQEALVMAQQASSAKGVFLSQMSHEIRTPLNAMIGYLNIALDNDNDLTTIRECLKKGLNASTHLLSIINDILDISSIESGKLKIAHEDFDFKHLLTGIVSMFYTQAKSRRIDFDLILNELTEEWLVGDSLRVNQILLNLLSNAMKFTPPGGSVTLTVKQLGIVKNRVQLMLKVADTGCGVRPEFMSRLFKPFEQQDDSTARVFGGTGLGLSITKNLVTLMGGTIAVESQINQGTTFTVHLSFEKSAKELLVAEADFSRLRALVVDDQAEDREYIKMVLAKCGVKCDVIGSGEEAIRQLERRIDSRHPYDLCLLDLRLPDMNGIEVARKMRQMGKNTNLPIILITAYDISSVTVEAHEAGVNRIIQKPLFQSTFFDFLMTCYYHQDEQKNNSEIKLALQGLRILLVEDNQMNMDISSQYLKRAGMIVTPAWNGQEAVDLFVSSPPGTFQVILMDIQMPIMDGYMATEIIRASTHPEAQTIPIIAMTANAFNEDVVKTLKAGMNDHISKPIFYDRLFVSLSKFTQKESD